MSSEPKRSRYMALVGALEGHRRETHTAGYPLDPSKLLPLADVVVLIADAEPGAMLFRYTAHGESSGDTWHESADAAREQATEEFGDALGEWLDVPDEITDAHAFAVRYAYEQLNGRGDW